MKKYALLLLSAAFTLIISCSSEDNSPDTPIEKPGKPDPKPDPTPKPEDTTGFNYIPIDKNQKAYYQNIDFTQRGENLKQSLHDLLVETHRPLSYTPDIWRACEITDENPDNPNEVILIYSWTNSDAKDVVHKRTINKSQTNNSSHTTDEQRRTLWEREHVFAKANAKKSTTSDGFPLYTANYKPDLEKDLITVIAGNDAHHLRAINGYWNNKRSNTSFADGTGNSGNQNGGWYPGDEWKGDVARMMMYMYLRYGELCMPSYNGKGASVPNYETGTVDMLTIYLKWNAEDPVSDIERKRNEYHGNINNRYAQGNRNPFIDNPKLANLIWGTNNNGNLDAKNIWQQIKPTK
ncbi:endonuclease I family protein [Myroides injenensis]|uniref:endonuclease I family protein n=1 Tax=Myroides injenensis TaxID=1183151 RepID=UPI00028A3901|nr:endonuclease [Myroides injenensis]